MEKQELKKKSQAGLPLCALLLLLANVAGVFAQMPQVGDTLQGGVVISYQAETGNVVILHPAEESNGKWNNANLWASGLGSGWRQPTLSELQIIYNNRTDIKPGLAKLTGATQLINNWYWSGSKDGASEVWAFGIGDGSVNKDGTSIGNFCARAVLAFNIFSNPSLLPEGLAAEKGGAVHNSIAWGNKSTSAAPANLQNNGGTVQYSAVEGTAPTGTGNTTVAATDFADAAGRDYHLTTASALATAGNSTLLPAGLTQDLDGRPRSSGSIISMGAYQSLVQYTVTASANTGGSISPAGDSLVIQGNNIRYAFAANAGYAVDSLLVDNVNDSDSIAGGSYTFNNVTADHTIRVVFIGMPTLELADKSVSYNGQPQGIDSVKIKLNNVEIGENNWVSYKYFLYGTDQNGQPHEAGNYKVVGYFAGNDTLDICQSDSADLIISAPGAPVITYQPEGAEVCTGSDHAFTVTATGYLLSYQWYFNGQAIAGEVSNQLQLSDLSPENTGSYTVTVSNPGGSATSQEAVLAVDSPAGITDDLADVSVCEGSNYTFKPGITGDKLIYQWYKGDNIIPGATGDTLEITGASFEVDYDTYRVEVSGVCGQPVQSAEARLWVAEKIPQPILFEVPDAVYRGQSTRLHVGYGYGYNDVTAYTWSFGQPNDGIYASDQHTVFVEFNTATDSQRVSLRMEHTCGPYEVYKDIRVDYPTGMDDLKIENLKLFPSPFRSEVNIRGAEGCMLRIVDASGLIVYTKKIKDAVETILTGHLPEGVYLFRLEKDGKVKTLKGAKN